MSAGQLGPRNRGLSSLVNREWPEECGINPAHAQGIKGAGVMLGILDTGMDADHPEHQDRLIQFRYVSLFPNSPQNPARDVRGFDPDGHGTHVAASPPASSTAWPPRWTSTSPRSSSPKPYARAWDG